MDADNTTPPEEGKGLSRRKFVGGAAAAGAALSLGGAGAALGGPRGPATPKAHANKQREALVFTRGRIHTMDGSNRVVDELRIENGKIVDLGNHVERAKAKVINLRGRTVVPGIVEPHIHVVSLANRPGYHTPTENARSIAEVQQLLAARRPSVPDGQFITSMGGFHINMFAERRFPTLAELDAAVSDRPVFMYQGFTGPAATNSLGKAFFESASDALAGPVTVGADGSITGGTQAQRALYHLRARQTYEDRLRSTHDAMAYAASQGMTAMLDQVLFPVVGPPTPNQVLSNLDGYRMYDSWLDLHRQGKTFVRLQINFLHNQGFIPALGPITELDKQLPELRERLKNQFQFFGDDMTMTGGIGEWAAPLATSGDGRTVWFEAQRLVGRAGWRNENAVGSLAQLEQVVSAYEAVDAEFGIKDLRWMVHHVPFVSEDLLNRLKALGGGVVMRGFQWITGTLGPGGVPSGAPFRTILDNGIKAALEGDGVHISTLNPWPHVQYAVTGFNALGQQINPGQSITRQEAVAAFTREAAWFLRMEDKIGSLEVGKLGDLAVLSQDPFAVPEADIYKTRSLLTVVGGEIVHDAGGVQ